MSPGNDRIRPAQADSLSISTPTSAFYDAVRAACEAYAVVVVTEQPDGELRYARRIYLSLHSSQKALKRAVQRGQRAELVLCRLPPLPEPGESAPTYFRLPLGGDAS